MNTNALKAKYQNKKITYEEAEQILYDFERNERFEVFIALYEATLKNDLNISFRVFKEAYCSSDNIFEQIKNSKTEFNLKAFLNFVKSSGIDFISLMTYDEKKCFDDLPNKFKIYRGISQNEHETKDYGVSWSLSDDMAKNYVYFKKNKVEKDKGALIDITVEKDNILTVFSVHGELEIIYIYKINPLSKST